MSPDAEQNLPHGVPLEAAARREFGADAPKSAIDRETLAGFWELGPGFDEITFEIAPPEQPLSILEKLGPSPFERGSFPLIGFLATTYDKVSRYALSRRGNQ